MHELPGDLTSTLGGEVLVVLVVVVMGFGARL